MKYGIILGTRPEIIKLSGLIKNLPNQTVLIHTNQHYSENLDDVFFDELDLPKPDYNLNVGSEDHSIQTAKILKEMKKIDDEENIDSYIVQGDTNSALGGALFASKAQKDLIHIEAGLRSYDWNMPEEKNRVMIDHLSDLLFAPTKQQKRVLENENVHGKIKVVGNTVVDAVNHAEKVAQKKYSFADDFILLTLHRPQNVDDKENLQEIIEAVHEISERTNLDIRFPAHPRTTKKLNEFSLTMPNEIHILEPLRYTKMIGSISNAKFALTDSGGIQEEACILGTPTLILRENTERPEVIEAGSALIGGTTKANILKKFKQLQDRPSSWNHPFGRKPTQKIVSSLKSFESAQNETS